MYAETEILFPYTALPALRQIRGEQWRALVNRVTTLPETHEETLALMLTVIRINGCVTCQSDSFRAMKGCAWCATQNLKRYKGSDEELLRLYEKHLQEVRLAAKAQPGLGIVSSAMS
jgi:hypothetical protein